MRILKVISLIILIPIELFLIITYLNENKEIDGVPNIFLVLMTIFIMPIIYICMT